MRIGGVRRARDRRPLHRRHQPGSGARTSGERFRADLYFRLDGLSLEIPPLRERLLEIRPLAEAFLRRSSWAATRAPPRLSEQAAPVARGATPGTATSASCATRWIGRCFCRDGDTIEPEHLPLETIRGRGGARTRRGGRCDRERDARGQRWEIVVYRGGERGARSDRGGAARQGGNQTRAARRLGMSRSTLILRLDDLGIARPQKRRS